VVEELNLFSRCLEADLSVQEIMPPASTLVQRFFGCLCGQGVNQFWRLAHISNQRLAQTSLEFFWLIWYHAVDAKQAAFSVLDGVTIALSFVVDA